MNKFLIALLAFSALHVSPAFALEVGDAAPCVELNDVQPNGTTINQCIRTKQPGHDYVMLEFFSTSCGDCSNNLPKVAKLAKEIAATTSVRLVGIDRDGNATMTYIHAHHDLINFPVALDTDRDAKTAYGVVETPTIFILDANNQVVYKQVDVFTDAQMDAIRKLVHAQ